jgi:hypothetical protein
MVAVLHNALIPGKKVNRRSACDQVDEAYDADASIVNIIIYVYIYIFILL